MRRTIEHGAFSIMMLLAVSLVAFASPALAQTNVSIDDAIVYVDEVVTRSIMINNVTDPAGVGTADIKLSFDSNVVHVTAFIAGDFDSIVPNLAHNESGADSYVTFMAYQVYNSGLPSGAIVATVTLKAVGTAGQESPLNITITMLANKTTLQGNVIPADDVDGTFTIIAPVLTTITVSPPTADRTVGDTEQFTATAYDQYDAPMAGVVITWTSTNTAVGTVDPASAITGVDGNATTSFTAVGAGTTTVMAANGTVNDTAAVTVTCVCGDVDPNEGLDARDVTYLACHVAGISGYETLYGDGDVDPNEGLDARDVTYLACHVAGISGYETLHC